MKRVWKKIEERGMEEEGNGMRGGGFIPVHADP